MKNWLLANLLPLLPASYKMRVLQNSITDDTIGEIKTAMGAKKFLHLLEDTSYSSLEEKMKIIEKITTIEERLDFLKTYKGDIDYTDAFLQNLLRSIPERRRFEYLPSEKRQETFIRIAQASRGLVGKSELKELPHEELLKLYLQIGTYAILEICTNDEKIAFLKENEESIDYNNLYVGILLNSIPITRRFSYISPEKRQETFFKIAQGNGYLLGIDELQEFPHEELLNMYFQDGNLLILDICTDDEKLAYLKANEDSINYADPQVPIRCVNPRIRELLTSIPINRRFEYISSEKRKETFLKIAQVDSYLLGTKELQELPHAELLDIYFQSGNAAILEVLTEEERLAYLKAKLVILDVFKLTNLIKSFSVETKLHLIAEGIVFPYPDTQISVKRLQTLRNVFGDWIIDKVIENMMHSTMSENMKELFSMPEEDFNNLMELFRSSKLTNDNVNTVYNAFVQKMFTKNREDVIRIFPRLKSMIDTKNEAGMEQILYQMCKEFSASMGFSVNEFLKTQDSEMGLSTQELFSQIGYQIKNSNEVINVIMEICKDMIRGGQTENQDIKMSVVHAFCNYYIKKCREQYMELQEKDKLLKLPKKISEDKLIKKAFSTISSDELFSLFRQVNLENLDETLKILLQNEELLRGCIEFKKNPSGSLKVDGNIKKQLRNFNALTKVLCSQGLLDSYATEEEMESFIPETFGKPILEILEKLDFDRLFANGESLGMGGKPYIGLFHNPEKLKELKELFQKYGFLAWDDIFQDLTELNQVEDYSTPTVFSALINQFEVVSSEIKTGSSNESLFKALKTAYLRTVDSRLINLLGKEDYDLLLKNPGPNSGGMNGKDRLQVAESLVPQMYQREFITIPPTNREFETLGGKKLRVVVGDTTSTINLTYGERTKACMRLDGVDAQLFHIALLDPNGFQIRFEDPETGKLVSRITGFRNGNSVFCNQLRCSLMSSEYTDEELLEVTKSYAQTLLEQTKDSAYPIQNVFIGPGYAIQGEFFVGITEPMDSNFKKDFQVGYFPTDIDKNSAMVLATTASDKEYEELNLGLEKAERYPVLRGPVTTQDVRRLNQLRFIDQKLSGGSLDEVALLSEDDVSQVITGADWYICIMKDGQVISKILDNLPESKRKVAQEEIKQVMENLRTRLHEENQVLEEKEENHGFGQK